MTPLALALMSNRDPRSVMSADEIRAYWSSQGERHGLAPASSWSDWRAIELEIEAISAYLSDGFEVLDAGCGTGYSSARYVAHAEVSLLGVDYVPQMIEHAVRRSSTLPSRLADRLEFRVGDVRALEAESEAFDRVIVTRVVINLADRAEQRRALHEFSRVLRDGGLLLLSEPTLQGLERLNALRQEWGLPNLPAPDFNLYLDEDVLSEDAGPDLLIQGVQNFASSYFVATRVFKPLLSRLPEVTIDPADPDAEFNRWAARLPPAGDYGTQKLFVFRKGH